MKNTSKIATPIFLVIKIQIKLTIFLKNNTAIANYDLKGRLSQGSQELDQDDNKKIEKAVAAVINNKNKAKNPGKKNKRLKKEKIYQKSLSKTKKKNLPKGQKS